MSEENFDLDSMINNPFRSIRQRTDRSTTRRISRPEETTAHPGVQPNRKEKPSPFEEERIPVIRSDTDEERAERNHPLGLRVLSLEKNEFIVAKKLDDMRRIIEHQNERIRLLEEELETLRKPADGQEA